MKKSSYLFFGVLLVFTIILTACSINTTEEKIATGNPAPEFTLNSSDGEQVSLSSYKGQPVLLFFHMAGG